MFAYFCKYLYYLLMHAKRADFEDIKQGLTNSKIIIQCAKQHNTVGDLSAMKICYLLQHHPNLSVSEVAELVRLSVSATSRSLAKLKATDVVSSNKVAQSVLYQLQDNDFTNQLVKQLEV